MCVFVKKKERSVLRESECVDCSKVNYYNWWVQLISDLRIYVTENEK